MSGTKLMLVESPGKIKTISGYLGDGWIVKASVGHIRDLPMKTMGIDFDSMTPEYVLTERGTDVVKGLRNVAKNAQEVYIATDADREGEAIAWHLQQVLNLKNNYKRITFGEITQSKILAAIANPSIINFPMVRAQEGRRMLDRVVGYIVSPELNKLKFSGKVSAGRVQSIVLKLVVERQLEIDKHKANEYYSINSLFGSWNATFDGSLNLSKDYIPDEKEPFRFTDKVKILKLSEALKSYPELKVSDVVKKKVARNAPSPFTTSLLQQAASVHLTFSPDKTMMVAQRLYELGLITYMRTDSTNLSQESIISIREWIQSYITKKGEGCDSLLPSTPNSFKSGDNAQEAHEAIRPSYINNLGSALEGDEKALYQLIWKRTVSSQCSPSITAQTRIVLQSVNIKLNEQPVSFVAIGEIPLFNGWKLISGGDKTDEKDDQEDSTSQMLPDVAVNDLFTPIGYESIAKKTRPPKRYTEASLVKALESRGVGRPSTYAALIKHVLTKKFMVVESRMITPTKLGFELYDALSTANFSFFNYDYTKNIEKQLDMISEGRFDCVQLLKKEYETLQKELPSLDKMPKAEKQQSAKPRTECCVMCDSPFTLIRPKGKPNLYKCKNCEYFVGSKPDGSIDKLKIPTKSSGDCPKCKTKTMLIINGLKGNYCKCIKCKSNIPVIY
jgi:DNA topoisomerase-1